jgi:CBS domain-containing protein
LSEVKGTWNRHASGIAPVSAAPPAVDNSAMNIGRTRISAVMTRKVCQIGPDQPAMEALALMRGQAVSSVLVTQEQHILGIITERDIVRAMHHRTDLKTLQCASLMHSPVITVGAATGCLDAYHLMTGQRIRHLVVTDGQAHVVGIVSEGDVMRNFGIEYYSKFKDVGSVMSTGFCKMPPSWLVSDALREMVESGQSCVVVVDEAGHPAGILSERDIVRLTSEHSPPEQLTLYEAMRTPVITIRPAKPLHAAVKAMEAAGIRRLVVIDDKGVACGVLTHHEVARGLEGDYVAYLKEMAELQSAGSAPGSHAIDDALVLANVLRAMTGTAALAADLEFRICHTTASAEKVLGLRAKDVAGADLRDTLRSVGWRNAAAALNRDALALCASNHQVTVAGSRLEFHVSALLDERGDGQGYLVLARRI